jgi:hypothetical protein
MSALDCTTTLNNFVRIENSAKQLYANKNNAKQLYANKKQYSINIILQC